jgi:hypothetical protein
MARGIYTSDFIYEVDDSPGEGATPCSNFIHAYSDGQI